MKKLFILLLLSAVSLQAQENDSNEELHIHKNSLTIGILQGGGSLVGVDYERMLGQYIGVQVGAGLIGAGAGVNIHFAPRVKSSLLSIQYRHQGFGSNHAQSMVGPSYIYRARKWFTFQVGVAALTRTGPAWPANTQHPGVLLTYSIGGYIPW